MSKTTDWTVRLAALGFGSWMLWNLVAVSVIKIINLSSVVQAQNKALQECHARDARPESMVPPPPR